MGSVNLLEMQYKRIACEQTPSHLQSSCRLRRLETSAKTTKDTWGLVQLEVWNFSKRKVSRQRWDHLIIVKQTL